MARKATNRKTGSGAPQDPTTAEPRRGSADDYMGFLKPLLPGIARTFGRNCEVVLHDFRKPEGSIVAIEGNVTDRHVGGSVSQIGLSIMAEGDDAKDEYIYLTRAPNGRVMKSTTVPLRDADGHVFGAFCINYDISDLRMVAGVLEDMIGSPAHPPQQTSFVDDVGKVISEVIQEEELAIGRRIDHLNRRDRLDLLLALDRRGVFSLQRAVPQVAEHLGVSRATLYADLRETRGDAAGEGEARTTRRGDRDARS